MIVHLRKENNRAICSIARLGIQLTDDPSEITCKICLKSIHKKQPEFSFANNERNNQAYVKKAAGY